MFELNYNALFEGAKDQAEEPKKVEERNPETPRQTEGGKDAPSHLCLKFSDEFMKTIRDNGKAVE